VQYIEKFGNIYTYITTSILSQIFWELLCILNQTVIDPLKFLDFYDMSYVKFIGSTIQVLRKNVSI